jgi:acetyl esterase
MPLHPQCKAFLDQLAALGGKQIHELPVPEARAMALGLIEFAGPEQPVARVENRTIPGPARPIPVRVYHPTPGEKLPVLVHFHGGGFVICNLDTHDRQCRALANSAGCVVVSVDYRLAPEHKYPAAVEDSFAATRYIADHPDEFGADGTRIAVGGDSAGGNLAAVVALMARERGGPRLAYQLLVYPLVDINDEHPSMRQFAQDHFLTREAMDWFMELYLPNPDKGREPYASPMNAGDFRGLPPAMIITAECDPLRDQGEAYARKLEAAGVPVLLKRYEGMIHPFFQFGGIIDAAKVAMSDTAAALRRALGTTAAAGGPA